MKPIIHALNSAKEFGGVPGVYFDIHQLMDISKSALPDVRHRMIFHHRLGVQLLPQVFGKTIQNTIGKRVSVEKIIEQHIIEDLSFVPTAKQYFALIPLEEWMTKAFDSFPTANSGFAKKHPKIYKFIKGWLMSNEKRSIIFVCNTFMPYLVEKAFGPLIGKIPTRDLVEKFISSFVEIQGLEFLLDDMKIENWMIRPAILQKDVVQQPQKKQKVIKQTIVRNYVHPMHRRLD